MANPIPELFDLMERSTPRQRDNLRNIYLSQFGAAIIPFCLEAFERSKDASFRNDLVRFVTRYARERDDVIRFAIQALADRSVKVRQSACGVLAFSCSQLAVQPLEELANSAKEPTAGHARNALEAIRYRNHNLFYPGYTWVVVQDDPSEPRDETVINFIEKPFPSLVPELVRILGSTRGKFRSSAASA